MRFWFSEEILVTIGLCASRRLGGEGMKSEQEYEFWCLPMLTIDVFLLTIILKIKQMLASSNSSKGNRMIGEGMEKKRYEDFNNYIMPEWILF